MCKKSLNPHFHQADQPFLKLPVDVDSTNWINQMSAPQIEV